MDEDDYLVGRQAEVGGDVGPEHVCDPLDFEEVVARPEGPDLVRPPVLRPLGYLRGVRLGTVSLVLAVRQVVLDGVPVFERPVQPPFENRVDFFDGPLVDATAAQSRRNRVEQRIDELLFVSPDVVVGESRLQHPDAAVDVVAHRAGRDTALLSVDTGDAAHWEAVALVAVRHAERVLLDARQMSGVLELGERQVVAYLVEQRLAGQYAGRDAHPVLLGNLPDVVPDLLERDVVGLVRSHVRHSVPQGKSVTHPTFAVSRPGQRPRRRRRPAGRTSCPARAAPHRA